MELVGEAVSIFRPNHVDVQARATDAGIPRLERTSKIGVETNRVEEPSLTPVRRAIEIDVG